MYVWWEAEISRFIKLSNTMDEKYFEWLILIYYIINILFNNWINKLQ
jgi:hypothetical protein